MPIGTRAGATPFILYGRDRVLAHRNLLAGFKGSVKEPLPALNAIGDPVIARMWDPSVRQPAAFPSRPPVENHVVEIDGVDHLVFYKEVTGFGPKPWIIGVHVEARVFGDSLVRLAIGAGLAARALRRRHRPAALALAIWTARAARRTTTRGTRWLVYPAIGVVTAAALGGTLATVTLALDDTSDTMPGALYDVGGCSRLRTFAP